MIKRQFLITGFTLIELMVTLSIGAILLTVAVPSFIQFQRNSELTTITNSLIAAINTARAEAMKTGMNALVVATNNGSDWSKGWVVFVDIDNDGSYSTGDTIVMTRDALPSHITVSGTNTIAATPSYIRYNSSGFSKPKLGDLANATINLSRNDVASTDYSQIRRIKIAKTGRPRVCTPQSDSDAACSKTED
jgi:type IV fimbrial biogenesis protein FimT